MCQTILAEIAETVLRKLNAPGDFWNRNCVFSEILFFSVKPLFKFLVNPIYPNLMDFFIWFTLFPEGIEWEERWAEPSQDGEHKAAAAPGQLEAWNWDDEEGEAWGFTGRIRRILWLLFGGGWRGLIYAPCKKS